MKKTLIRLKDWFVAHLPTKRRLIQLYAALLFNANLKGLIKEGTFYKGPLKYACAPGLGCYSCPSASGACPIGALQNALYSSPARYPYYVFGIIMLWGILFGRFICGFLCPFGFIQDLLYKIKTPKLKKSRVTRVLSCFKYFILVFFVLILPLLYAFRDFPLPAFCKYICPAGTLEGAIGLLVHSENSNMFRMLGPLFTWKFGLMVSIIVGAVFIYRIFCRFFCPLGALYGLFNRFSVLGIKLEKPSCTNCGRCISVCKMDIKSVGDRECINCGECVSSCPANAIQWRGAKILLPESEIEIPNYISKEKREALEALRDAEAAKQKKRANVIKIVIGSLMTALLALTLVYYNFIYEEPQIETPPVVEPDDPDEPEEPSDPGENPGENPDGEPVEPEKPKPSQGSEIGNLCYGVSIPLYDGTYFNPAAADGKIVVINFWGTWCGPCKAELPHFNEIAAEYADDVVILTIHTHDDRDDAPSYIEKNYSDSKMLFGYDLAGDGFYYLLGGNNSWPMTVILDKDGVITDKYIGAITKNTLKGDIEENLTK